METIQKEGKKIRKIAIVSFQQSDDICVFSVCRVCGTLVCPAFSFPCLGFHPPPPPSQKAFKVVAAKATREPIKKKGGKKTKT